MQSLLVGNFLKVYNLEWHVDCWVNIKKISEIRNSENDDECFVIVEKRRFFICAPSDEIARMLFQKA